jgi:hypothetical protein
MCQLDLPRLFGSTYHFRLQSTNVFYRLRIFLGVFDQDVDDHVILTMFCCQVCGLLIVSSLAAHGNCGLKIELQLAGSFDKRVQLARVFELSVAVQKECRVINRGTTMIM